MSLKQQLLVNLSPCSMALGKLNIITEGSYLSPHKRNLQPNVLVPAMSHPLTFVKSRYLDGYFRPCVLAKMTEHLMQ